MAARRLIFEFQLRNSPALMKTFDDRSLIILFFATGAMPPRWLENIGNPAGGFKNFARLSERRIRLIQR